MNERTPVRRADVAVIIGAVLVFAASGLALVLWAEAREYRDNQRNWALIGGWSGLGVAGVIALLGLAAFIRRRGSRRAQLAFAVALGIVSMATLLAAAVS